MRQLVAVAGLLSLAVALPAQAADPSASKSASSKREKIVCRTKQETGSLVKKKRTCATEGVWKRHTDQTQDDAERLFSRTSSERGG
jgi:hypothetical protein